jgi:hypothetical protein
MTREKIRELTSEELRDFLCAPAPTDDLEDIEFDGDEAFYESYEGFYGNPYENSGEEAERKFIEEWLDAETYWQEE